MPVAVKVWVGPRHRIIAMPTPRMATTKPIRRKSAAVQRPVTLQRLQRVDRARRLKAAAIANPWRQNQPIGIDRQRQDFGGGRHGLTRCTDDSALSRSDFSDRKSRELVASGLATST